MLRMFISIQFREKIVMDCAVVEYSLYYVKQGYIGSFKLNWICFVFCQKDGFFESFNRHNRTFIGLNGCMN
jgi:hypothetical protein